MDFEIVVCGAGPAGSSAALKATQEGRSVLLVDRKERPGVPVCCAEGLSRSMVADYLDVNPGWISNHVDGAWVVSDDMRTLVNYPKVGYILDRKKFDYGLVQLAVAEGAEFLTGEITEIEPGRLIVDCGKKREIIFKIPIIADGVESRLARMLGIDTTLTQQEIHSCAQYLISGIDYDRKHVTFILDRELIPGGYGWVFPKGDDGCNFGLGISPHLAQRHPIFYLNKLKKKIFPDGQIERTSGGIVPSHYIDLSKAETFVVGDAGRLCDPLSGGGIANAIKSGYLAGLYASQILSGKSSFKNYCKALKKEIVDELLFHEQVRKIYLKLHNDDFKELIKVLNRIYKGETVRDIDSKHLVFQVLKSSPHLLKIGFRLLKQYLPGTI